MNYNEGDGMSDFLGNLGWPEAAEMLVIYLLFALIIGRMRECLCCVSNGVDE